MSVADRKELDTLAAQFALLGHSLIEARPDDPQAPLYVTRWGWLKPIPDLAAARCFLEQLMVPNEH